MRPTFYLIVSLLLLSISGCQNGQNGIESGEADSSVGKEQLLVTPAAAPAPLLSDRKIIREAHIRFQVENLQESSNRIEALVKKYNATLTNSSSYNGEASIEAAYTIKVIPEKLLDLVKAIQGESIFLDDKTITAEDVTRQYVDVEARVKAKKTAQQRYLELMKQATKVEDVLAIERELQKVQEELESVQAQLKALQQQTSYSTINLTMYQLVPASYTDRTSFASRLTSAFSGGWQLFKDLVVGLLYLWPLLTLVALAVLAIRWRKKKDRSIVA